jgi:uncharacterized membrane-anchored protein
MRRIKTSTVETLVWVCVYGGLLAFSLGTFAARHDADAGQWLQWGGGVTVAVGALLVWLRSRMKATGS